LQFGAAVPQVQQDWPLPQALPQPVQLAVLGGVQTPSQQ
jgi:hypothetical protein